MPGFDFKKKEKQADSLFPQSHHQPKRSWQAIYQKLQHSAVPVALTNHINATTVIEGHDPTGVGVKHLTLIGSLLRNRIGPKDNNETIVLINKALKTSLTS